MKKKTTLLSIPFLISFMLWLTVFGISIVASGSMNNTLSKGDIIFSLKSCVAGEVERGNIISFKSNSEKGKKMIKRVIGLPGETVEIYAGKVYIDGELLEEDYIAEVMCPYDVGLNKTTYELYDYGDEPVSPYSYDTEGNTIKWYVVQNDQKFEITENKLYHQIFQVPEGCYFVMGDNRNNSDDSRYWEDHFVEEDEILAITAMKLYPRFEYLGKE